MKTMLKFTILFTSIVFCFSCGYNKNIVFKDSFKDNRNNWDLKNNYDDFSVNISDGNLNIEKHTKNSVNNGCLWLNKEIDGFSTDKDFSIVFSAKIMNYDSISNRIDFQWGTINEPMVKSRLYQINFSIYGDIYLDYLENGWERLSRKQLKSDIKSNLKINGVEYSDQPYPVISNIYNKYEIYQVGDSCLISINGIIVYSEKINVVPGNYIGIQQCLKSSWKIDYIEITQEN